MSVKLYHSLILLVAAGSVVLFTMMCFLPFYLCQSCWKLPILFLKEQFISLIFFFTVFLVSISFPLLALGLFCSSNFLRLRAWVTDFKPFLFSCNYLGPFVSANVLHSPLLLDSDQLKGICVTPKERRW